MRKVKSEVMPKYSLDLAFSSTIPSGCPDKDTAMLALGYGWTEGDPWTKDGQKEEKVVPGARVYFVVYDGQPSPYALGQVPSITEFELKFTSVTSPLHKDSIVFSTPFADSEGTSIPNPITAKGPFPFSDESHGSTGCNIVGYRCEPLKGTAYYVNPKILEGTVYKCTVKFTVQCGDGRPKTFKVDPQMIVGGGG